MQEPLNPLDKNLLAILYSTQATFIAGPLPPRLYQPRKTVPSRHGRPYEPRKSSTTRGPTGGKRSGTAALNRLRIIKEAVFFIFIKTHSEKRVII